MSTYAQTEQQEHDAMTRSAILDAAEQGALIRSEGLDDFGTNDADLDSEQAALRERIIEAFEFDPLGESEEGIIELMEEHIRERPLSIEFRSGWYGFRDPGQPVEFKVLLTTGGPHVEIRGKLDGEHPDPASIEAVEYGWFAANRSTLRAAFVLGSDGEHHDMSADVAEWLRIAGVDTDLLG